MRIVLILLLAATGACGNEIGDSCGSSADCSPNGDRLCDNTQPGGYCTVLGCDFDTCPEESVCVRFYSVGDTGKFCDPETEDVSTNDCTAEERCGLRGSCLPRASEVRYCMRKCGSQGDCRGEYECRDMALMLEHGGEPVRAPGDESDVPQSFCAVAPI